MSSIPKKKCKSCRKMFIPTRPMQTTCSFECAIEHSKRPKVQKAYQMEKKKELREKFPDKSKELKLTQSTVNEYIRLRDKNKSSYLVELLKTFNIMPDTLDLWEITSS